MIPPPTPDILETSPTHLSLRQHLNSAHICPFFYIPSAKALVKPLITSYLGYSNGLITDLSASSFAFPVYFHVHTFTQEVSFGWNYALPSHSLQSPTARTSKPKGQAELTVQHS